MAKKAVQLQERLEKLIAGTNANPDGPRLDLARLNQHVATLNDLEYKVLQAKQTLRAATKARDNELTAALDSVNRSEYAVKAHYGRASSKLRDFIDSHSHPKKKQAAAPEEN